MDGIRRAATDLRSWMVILLVGFLYVSGSAVYQRPAPDSRLAVAIAKVPWIDAKLTEFDDAARQFNGMPGSDIRASQALAKMERIATDVVGEPGRSAMGEMALDAFQMIISDTPNEMINKMRQRIAKECARFETIVNSARQQQ